MACHLAIIAINRAMTEQRMVMSKLAGFLSCFTSM
jgi:uncharacterized coiled-coil protein SlyX